MPHLRGNNADFVNGSRLLSTLTRFGFDGRASRKQINSSALPAPAPLASTPVSNGACPVRRFYCR